MKMKYILSALMISPLMMAQPVMADHPQTPYSGWSWSANMGQLLLDKKVAQRNDLQLGEEVFVLGVAAEHFSSESDMTYSLGLNYLSFNDKNPFWLEDRYGNLDQSNAWGVMLYAEAGPRYRFGIHDAGFFSAKFGVSGVTASRDVSNCNDCYNEDLNIDGGLYGTLAAGYSFSYFDLSLQCQQYFTGDFNNGLSLKISTTF